MSLALCLADNYQKAVRKINKAEETSDLQTQAEEDAASNKQQQKRKRVLVHSKMSP